MYLSSCRNSNCFSTVVNDISLLSNCFSPAANDISLLGNCFSPAANDISLLSNCFSPVVNDISLLGNCFSPAANDISLLGNCFSPVANDISLLSNCFSTGRGDGRGEECKSESPFGTLISQSYALKTDAKVRKKGVTPVAHALYYKRFGGYSPNLDYFYPIEDFSINNYLHHRPKFRPTDCAALM